MVMFHRLVLHQRATVIRPLNMVMSGCAVVECISNQIIMYSYIYHICIYCIHTSYVNIDNGGVPLLRLQNLNLSPWCSCFTSWSPQRSITWWQRELNHGADWRNDHRFTMVNGYDMDVRTEDIVYYMRVMDLLQFTGRCDMDMTWNRFRVWSQEMPELG